MQKKGGGLVAVARLAGVSTATVSNVLNRPELVAPTTRERVHVALRELDYVPSGAAVALRTGTSRMIGLVVPDITNPFYAAIAEGVTAAADEARYGVALCVNHDDPARERRQFELLAQQRAVGALVVPLSAGASRLSTLRRVGTHLVLVDRIAERDDGCSVAIDDVLGGRLAVRHLLALRGPRIAIVNGPRTIEQCANRRAGARQELRRSGVDPAAMLELTVDEMTVDAGRGAGRLLAASEGVDGVFCTNDQLATGVIRGLADGGTRVPDDVAVVGYGDLALATAGPLPLTTVSQPKELMGRTAVETLVREIRDQEVDGPPHQHSATLFQPSLVVRDSAPAT
jgi:LacI family transcriptional regulator